MVKLSFLLKLKVVCIYKVLKRQSNLRFGMLCIKSPNKQSNVIKNKKNSCFSVAQLLLVTSSTKINFDLFIFLYTVQTPLYPHLFLATTTNALILIIVKLSVIEMSFPFSLFFLVNTRFLSLHLTNVMRNAHWFCFYPCSETYFALDQYLLDKSYLHILYWCFHSDFPLHDA